MFYLWMSGCVAWPLSTTCWLHVTPPESAEREKHELGRKNEFCAAYFCVRRLLLAHHINLQYSPNKKRNSFDAMDAFDQSSARTAKNTKGSQQNAIQMQKKCVYERNL